MSTLTFFSEVKSAWVMIVCLWYVGWVRGVVAVIATGPRSTCAHQRMPRALMQVDRFRRQLGVWVITQDFCFLFYLIPMTIVEDARVL